MAGRAIVAGVISICLRLGLRCVLEGVETDDDRAVLPAPDPDLIHGSCFGRPMTGGGGARRRLAPGFPGAHPGVPLRRISAMKNSPPARPVITPIGMSCGGMITRATMSAPTRKIAPPSAESGRTRR